MLPTFSSILLCANDRLVACLFVKKKKKRAGRGWLSDRTLPENAVAAPHTTLPSNWPFRMTHLTYTRNRIVCELSTKTQPRRNVYVQFCKLVNTKFRVLFPVHTKVKVYFCLSRLLLKCHPAMVWVLNFYLNRFFISIPHFEPIGVHRQCTRHRLNFVCTRAQINLCIFNLWIYAHVLFFFYRMETVIFMYRRLNKKGYLVELFNCVFDRTEQLNEWVVIDKTIKK